MGNRREFIQSGIALTAWSLTAGEAAAAAVPAPATAAATLTLDRFVVDTRFAVSRSAGHQAAAAGVRLAAMDGDVTRIWYDDFDPTWRQAPMALAGITMPSALFVLEMLAADHRMRVVYRGEHRFGPGERVGHSLAGPAALVDGITARDDGSRWEASVAHALLSCPLGRLPVARRSVGYQCAQAPAGADVLVSWIIAPRSRVAPLA